MINGIKGNTISEADTKKKINELNEIKKVETNSKRLIENQKKLLRLFDDLKTIFNVNETKSFEDQINIFKKIPDLQHYWYIEYYEDNKETNLRLFKLKFAHILNNVDDNLFKEIFGFTSVELADKLINITNKEENQMLINDIEINRDKIFEQDEFNKFLIQPAHNCYALLIVKML